jgi:hypothetical protein
MPGNLTRSLVCCLVAAPLLTAPRALAAQRPPATARPATVELVPAELAGVVRDTAGKPLRDAEIMIPAGAQSARTGSDGKFVLGGVAPGFHEVWIRHIGNVSVPFDWSAEEGKRVEIAVTLRPLPNTLDPIVVYATESRSLSSTSMVSGVVVDSGGLPLANADLQLIGTTRTTVSASDGSFEFRHVPAGMMTLRARHLGFAPSTRMIELTSDDQRGVMIRLRRLDVMLDTVKVVEESGYGSTDKAWQEFGSRERWRNSAGGPAFALGPKRLAEAGGMPLDWLLRGYIGEAQGVRAPSRIDPGNGGREVKAGANPLTSDLACILENGIYPRWIPLYTYAASEVDRIEYYPSAPPEFEYTGTVEARMRMFPACGKTPSGGHPSYYVLWLKNAR